MNLRLISLTLGLLSLLGCAKSYDVKSLKDIGSDRALIGEVRLVGFHKDEVPAGDAKTVFLIATENPNEKAGVVHDGAFEGLFNLTKFSADKFEFAARATPGALYLRSVKIVVEDSTARWFNAYRIKVLIPPAESRCDYIGVLELRPKGPNEFYLRILDEFKARKKRPTGVEGCVLTKNLAEYE